MTATSLEKSYSLAKERYAEWGVDADAAMKRLEGIAISVQCWQGDDVGGFESAGGLTRRRHHGHRQLPRPGPERRRAARRRRQGLQPHPGQAPLQPARDLLGARRQAGGAERVAPEHFQRWMDWAAELGIGLDFNPTFFSHPKAADGFTLAHRDPGIRRFWVEHGIACRKIGEAFGRRLGTPCVTNVWIPDGMKDVTIDRKGPREILERSLDELFAPPIDPAHNLDAVESKLFGIGSETYVVGSHEFYLGYAVANKKLLTPRRRPLPSHRDDRRQDFVGPLFLDEILLHVSRGVRWDSDHVVILSDDLRAIAEEIVRGDFLSRVHIGLDFFDASINRVAAWVIGTRAMLKALLAGLARTDGQAPRVGDGRRFHRAAGVGRKRSRPCRWAPCGTTIARCRACRWARRGWTK